MVSIIVVEPKNAGNIGAIARLMNNFSADSLILVRPKCNHLSKESYDRATHGKRYLDEAQVVQEIPYIQFDQVIATSARTSGPNNPERQPILLHEFELKTKNSAILLGREDSGLTNEEVSKADILIHIPVPSNEPSLNISHALAVILYEWNKKQFHTENLAGRPEKEALLSRIEGYINLLELPRKEQKITHRLVFSKIINQSPLTSIDVRTLHSFFKEIGELIKASKP